MRVCPRCSTCLDDDVEVCPLDEATLEPSIPGTRVIDGTYRLERVLGTGGMGVVFRARHLGLERSCAVKVIELSSSSDPEIEARFRLEAAALGRLKHPNIVDVTDFGVDSRERGLAYLVMEYLEGSTLADYSLRHRPLPVDLILHVIDGVAAAIDYAHANGVLHRDLKPSNIFLVGLSGRAIHAEGA